MESSFFLFDLRIIFLYFFVKFSFFYRESISIYYFDKFYNFIIYFGILSNRQTEYLFWGILNGFLDRKQKRNKSNQFRLTKPFFQLVSHRSLCAPESKMLGTVLTQFFFLRLNRRTEGGRGEKKKKTIVPSDTINACSKNLSRIKRIFIRRYIVDNKRFLATCPIDRKRERERFPSKFHYPSIFIEFKRTDRSKENQQRA